MSDEWRAKNRGELNLRLFGPETPVLLINVFPVCAGSQPDFEQQFPSSLFDLRNPPT